MRMKVFKNEMIGEKMTLNLLKEETVEAIDFKW